MATFERIDALRRELRGLELPPIAMPLEYARVWRERMARHRAIADLMRRTRPAQAVKEGMTGKTDGDDKS